MAKCINVKYDGKPLYDIVIEKSFSRLSDEFNKLGVTGRKLCIVSDSNVARLYADDVAKELEKTSLFGNIAPDDFPSSSVDCLCQTFIDRLFHSLKSLRILFALHFLDVQCSGAFVPFPARLDLLDNKFVRVGSDISLLFDVRCIPVCLSELECDFLISGLESACDARFFYSG